LAEHHRPRDQLVPAEQRLPYGPPRLSRRPLEPAAGAAPPARGADRSAAQRTLAGRVRREAVHRLRGLEWPPRLTARDRPSASARSSASGAIRSPSSRTTRAASAT